MSSRTTDLDSPSIGERMRELAADRLKAIAGCNCGRDGYGNINHLSACPLHPGLPPAEPPCPALAILADHRRAVADAIEGDGR